MKGETILCLAAAGWEGMWARAQQFMSLFARQGNQVIYVDPPITYLSPFKNPALRGQIHDSFRQVLDNLIVYSPTVILPFGNLYRTINHVNQKILSAGLQRVSRELSLTPTVCWTYLPNTVDLKLSGAVTLVYDCADEHTAFPGFINQAVVARMEKELFARADAALASARELYLNKKALAPGLVVVPNGADVAHFKTALEPGLPLPGEVASLPRPVVGYVGAVSAWLDQEMLCAAARAHPEWSVVLIGPVDTDVAALQGMPNVHLLGRKEYKQLPAYLKGFDVTVIPFKINELTRGVNPVKLYEYLAAGKPVVSSELPEVRAFSPEVAIALDPQDFVKKLEQELAGDSPEKTARRVKMAEQNSWEARVLAAEEVIEARNKMNMQAGQNP